MDNVGHFLHFILYFFHELCSQMSNPGLNISFKNVYILEPQGKWLNQQFKLSVSQIPESYKNRGIYHWIQHQRRSTLCRSTLCRSTTQIYKDKFYIVNLSTFTDIHKKQKSLVVELLFYQERVQIPVVSLQLQWSVCHL